MTTFNGERFDEVVAKRCSFCGTTEDLTVGTGGVNACADCRAEAEPARAEAAE